MGKYRAGQRLTLTGWKLLVGKGTLRSKQRTDNARAFNFGLFLGAKEIQIGNPLCIWRLWLLVY